MKKFWTSLKQKQLKKTTKIQIKLVTTYNNNEQQQDGKNMAEFVDQMDEGGLEKLRRVY
jgi:hypothetical protein